MHCFDANGELYHDFEPCQHGSMMLPINWTGQPPEYWILSPNVEDGGHVRRLGAQGVRVSRRRASRHVRRRAGPDRRLPGRNRGLGPVRGMDLHAERQSQVRPALQTQAQRACSITPTTRPPSRCRAGRTANHRGSGKNIPICARAISPSASRALDFNRDHRSSAGLQPVFRRNGISPAFGGKTVRLTITE